MMILNLVPVSGTDLFEGAVKQILTDSVCPTRSAFVASRTFICIGSCAVVTPPSVAVPFLLLTSHEQKHSEQNRPANSARHKLAPNFCEVLILREIEGMSYKE